MRRRLRDRLRGCADAGHGFSFPYCVDASNEPNEYCDSIDITLMKTAKQEHDANISGLRRLCYGWILSPVRMVAFLAASHTCHSVAFRITDSCSLWCGGRSDSLLFDCGKNVYFVQKWRFENAYFAQNQAFEIVCFVHFMS
ncbi:hypothetical protein [Bifidobacterium adolescentis]|uniref:hypothetical protein n=2 Tax=Bifidobacterium adolescentis TaxID=1680 RepID=UPI0022E3346D|nr:hypothetical protein [Bifidobacterium adolescentis]